MTKPHLLRLTWMSIVLKGNERKISLQLFMVVRDFSDLKLHIAVVGFASRMWFRCVWKSKLRRQPKSTQQKLGTLEVLQIQQNEFFVVSVIDFSYQ